MKKQNAGLIALSIVFIIMGGFSTVYNLSKYVSNRVFMSSAEKTTGVHKRDLHRHILCESERKSERVLQH